MKNLYKYKVIVFDMDGLLLDTEKIAFNLFKAVCEKFHFSPKLNEYVPFIGISKEARNSLLSEMKDNLPYDDIIELWDYKYKKFLKEKPLPIKLGVINFLKYLKCKGKIIAVATSTHQKLAEYKLNKTNLFNYFDLIIGGDKVKKSKPNPDIYLHVQSKLRFNKSQYLVFEDSTKGIEAGYKAGMDVVQIIDLINPTKSTINQTLGQYDSFVSFMEQ